MNQPSVLQQKFPLSPRKFWKKMIPKFIGSIIIPLFFLTLLLPFYLESDGSFKTDIGITIEFALICSFLISLIIIFFNVWYIKAYIRSYYYAGEEHFITIKKGVFAPTEIHVQWQKIQDVYVDQDIFDRIMGLYDVHIASATASSGIEAHIDGVDEAASNGLKEFFLKKISGAGMNSNQNNNTSTSPNQTQTLQASQSKINLSESISSKNYPLSGKWTLVALLGRIGNSILISLSIMVILFIKIINLESIEDWVYMVMGWLALSIFVIIVRIITFFLWKRNYAFDFTPEHIYYREGVISISEKHMPYSSIQDVTVKQGVIERLFGLASVVIENAAQQQMIIGNQSRQIAATNGVVIQGLSIADANKITDILKTTVLGKNSSRFGL